MSSIPHALAIPAGETDFLTDISGPWLSNKCRGDAHDIDAVAQKLADVSGDATQAAKFSQYLEKTVQLDRASIPEICASLDTESKGVVLHVLGSSPDVAEHATKRTKVIAFVGRAMLAAVFMDRLVHLADPTDPAALVHAKPFALTSTFIKDMSPYHTAGWIQCLRKSKKAWIARNGESTEVVPPLQGVPFPTLENLSRSGRRNEERLVDQNLGAAVYMMQVLLLGEPHLQSPTTIAKLEPLESSEQDVSAATQPVPTPAQCTRVRKQVWDISTALWWALTQTPLVLLASNHCYTHKSKVSDFWCALLWRRRANVHTLTPGHKLAGIERFLWILLLEAAIGRRPVASIAPTFFGDTTVEDVMNTVTADASLFYPGDPHGISLSTPCAWDNLIAFDDDESANPMKDVHLEVNVPDWPPTVSFSVPDVNMSAIGPASSPPQTDADRDMSELSDMSDVERDLDPERESLALVDNSGSTASSAAVKSGTTGPAAASTDESTPATASTESNPAGATLETSGLAGSPADNSGEAAASTDKSVEAAGSIDKSGTASSPADKSVEAVASTDKSVEAAASIDKSGTARSPGDKSGEAGASTVQSGPVLAAPGQRAPVDDEHDADDEDDEDEGEPKAVGKKRKRLEVEPSTRQTRSATGCLAPPVVVPDRPVKMAKLAYNASRTTADSAQSAAASAQSAAASAQSAAASVQPVSDVSPGSPQWLYITNSVPPTATEAEVLREKLSLKENLNPELTYPLVPAKQALKIPYYKPVVKGETIEFTKCEFVHRGFNSMKSDVAELKKIVESQPRADEDGELKPLHTHRAAQKLPTGPPKHNESAIYVTTWDAWLALSVEQRLAITRDYCVAAHHAPLKKDGRQLKFTPRDIALFTSPAAPAMIHDLGRRKDRRTPIVAGRATDLVVVAQVRNEAKKPDRGQALNLLASHLGNKDLGVPNDSGIATEQTAVTHLQRSTVVPPYDLPQKELKFAIYANKGTMTWPHVDILSTCLWMYVGSKLWFLARDKTGDMSLRSFFENYDPWSAMTDRMDWECLYLDETVTLIMPGGKIHAVKTIEDSIAVGSHHVPASNTTNCVFNALHNVMVSSFTTNADHEPARLILLKMFQFIGLSLVDKYSTSEGLQADTTFQPDDYLTEHLPDLLTAQGLIDLLALRSFVIIFLSLRTAAYASLRDGALPVTEDIRREVESTWTVAAALDRHISGRYYLYTPGQPNADFKEKATLAAVTMAVAMAQYHKDTPAEYTSKIHEGFTTAEFSKQLRTMLVAYECHAERYNKTYDDQEVKETLFPEVRFDETPLPQNSLSGRVFDSMMEIDVPSLQPWTVENLPFKIRTKPITLNSKF